MEIDNIEEENIFYKLYNELEYSNILLFQFSFIPKGILFYFLVYNILSVLVNYGTYENIVMANNNNILILSIFLNRNNEIDISKTLKVEINCKNNVNVFYYYFFIDCKMGYFWFILFNR